MRERPRNREDLDWLPGAVLAGGVAVVALSIATSTLPADKLVIAVMAVTLATWGIYREVIDYLASLPSRDDPPAETNAFLPRTRGRWR